MTIFKIRTTAPIGRFETAIRASAERKLAEVRKTDPNAKILALPVAR